MMITEDEYELPIFSAETVEKLSEITGYSVAAIQQNISRGRRNMTTKRFVMVTYDWDEDKKPKKDSKLLCFTKDNAFVGEYRSAREGAEAIGAKNIRSAVININMCAKGKRYTACGYRWERQCD